MSDDLISRQAAEMALIEKGQNSRRYKWGEIWELNGSEIREVLDNLPSVQPKEKTGKWQEAYNPNESPFFQRKFYCSCCREWNTYGKTVYCMNCGAKMEV